MRDAVPRLLVAVRSGEVCGKLLVTPEHYVAQHALAELGPESVFLLGYRGLLIPALPNTR